MPSSVLLASWTVSVRRRRLAVVVDAPAVLRLALDSCKDADLGVADEVNEDHRPGRVRGQRVVELGRERAERGQPRPRHRGEVVVLVVVTDLDEQMKLIPI